MSDIENYQEEELQNSQTLLESARKKAAETLNIDLRVPQQEKRIEALEKLYEKYINEVDVRGLIYREIIRDCDELIDIHRIKQEQLDELRIVNESFSSIKIRLENINFKYKSVVQELEDKIYFNKQLLKAYESKYVNEEGIDSVYGRKLKELGDICWDNWLKALDVNKELRNTIIGFENRKTLLEISRAYVDYFILSDVEISKCFDKVKQLKKDGIVEYYDTLSKYQMPVDKRVDFKMFLQKKIESKLFDAMEIKSLFGEFADIQRKQIDDLVGEIRAQYQKDQMDMCSIINHYKQFLLNKQVLFTNESEQLVIYFKKRYIEKIDFLCSRFQMFSTELAASNRKISEENFALLKKIIDEEFSSNLNKLKIEYSKKFIPLLDNFWHMEQSTGTAYALDETELNKKLKDLKMSKNLGLKGLIAEFEAEREKIKNHYDHKMELLSDITKSGSAEFDVFLKDLRDECDVLCCDIINLNARFWTKANAQFNCEARKYLIKLRHQYAPYIDSWKANSKPWMNEYLINNFNQELLKAAGEALKDFSPESELYLRSSKALLRFNEITRKAMSRRDNIEAEQLLALNTLPSSNVDGLRQVSFNKLDELRKCYENFWDNYDSFYNSLLEDEI